MLVRVLVHVGYIVIGLVLMLIVAPALFLVLGGIVATTTSTATTFLIGNLITVNQLAYYFGITYIVVGVVGAIGFIICVAGCVDPMAHKREYEASTKPKVRIRTKESCQCPSCGAPILYYAKSCPSCDAQLEWQ